MSFQQPAPMTIRSFHFRGNAYEFPVESVLESQSGNGQLLIEASSGYLLTTLADTTPQSVQALSYVRQADGSWIARTTVTLLASGSALISGSVTLRDPSGETVTLFVNIETSLTIDGSLIQFNETEPGRKAFAILKISQQGAQTPIIISTDDPDQFTLAMSGKELNFVPNLTITPAFDGIYIHIRYVPNRPGLHASHLVVNTPYTSQTVSLEGYASGMSDWSKLQQRGIFWIRQSKQVIQLGIKQAQKLRIPAILFVGGLVYIGYTYRCQLAPGLCQSQRTTAEPISPRPDTVSITTRVPATDTTNERLTNKQTETIEVPKKADEIRKAEKQSSEHVPQSISKVAPKEPAKLSKKAQVYNQTRPKRRTISRNRVKSQKSHAESDLENALNGKLNK